MRYLSIDFEATGLDRDCLILEFACVPFCTQEKKIYSELAQEYIISSPSFEELAPKLDPWVVEHNEKMIRRSHQEGISLADWKKQFESYITSFEIKKFFGPEKIVLFGKSMNAIDLPFLSRDLGWDWMRKFFHHRVMDLSCFTYGLIDMKLLPQGHDSGSTLMKYLSMGEVAHTAVDDARNTAIMYLKLLEKFSAPAT